MIEYKPKFLAHPLIDNSRFNVKLINYFKQCTANPDTEPSAKEIVIPNCLAGKINFVIRHTTRTNVEAGFNISYHKRIWPLASVFRYSHIETGDDNSVNTGDYNPKTKETKYMTK
ncbi:hypothetical protein [Candidatus Sororendozoicomonas aggregata]|uniref:hypothetical protein n=1 Tax=Candidatus Sororendozoicomonas aggregata TaxID=3073239 RepID=UPI002ED46A91